jgi:hypothetical protein
MRLTLITAALMSALSISTIAVAQPAPDAAPAAKVKAGERIYSADGSAIGRVEYVDKAKDGGAKDVAVIYNMHMVHIPADSLSTGPNGYVTTLKRADVAKLN